MSSLSTKLPDPTDLKENLDGAVVEYTFVPSRSYTLFDLVHVACSIRRARYRGRVNTFELSLLCLDDRKAIRVFRAVYLTRGLNPCSTVIFWAWKPSLRNSDSPDSNLSDWDLTVIK